MEALLKQIGEVKVEVKKCPACQQLSLFLKTSQKICYECSKEQKAQEEQGVERHG